MSAFLFTGLKSWFHQGRFVDSCEDLILYGGDEETSRKRFEAWLLRSDDAENPAPAKIERIVCAPIVEQLLTEAGPVPLDWSRLPEEVRRALEQAGAEDSGQGYWVDCSQCLNPADLSPSLERLERELPEEIRSGLNWSADQTHFFLISALSPPPPPRQFGEELREEELSDGGREENLDEDEAGALTLRRGQEAFPGLVEKDRAALVQARNSVVAAWLWWKYAASTPWAASAIRIDAWCGALPLDASRP